MLGRCVRSAGPWPLSKFPSHLKSQHPC
jgi:hypothetical protein